MRARNLNTSYIAGSNGMQCCAPSVPSKTIILKPIAYRDWRQDTLSIETESKVMRNATSTLVLDIKAFMLLSESEDYTRRLVKESLLDSHDEDVQKFVTIVGQDRIARPPHQRGNILISLGELILSSFLFVAGLAVLAPSVIGISSPQQLLDYFASVFSESSTSIQSLSEPLIGPLVFLLAILLLVGAFYTLRVASSSLKQASTDATPEGTEAEQKKKEEGLQEQQK